MKRNILTIIYLVFTIAQTLALNNGKVEFNQYSEKKQIDVKINGLFLTTLLYSDTLNRPCLFPIFIPSGVNIVRGYPLNPKPNERVDHPHHYGLWFNHGNVNGLDFWNNSFAVKPELKHKYGRIIVEKILQLNSAKGRLVTLSRWEDNEQQVLLREKTTYVFWGKGKTRTIERISELTSVKLVTLGESKEGMFGLRVDRAFETPNDKPVKRVAVNGEIDEIPSVNNDGVDGIYRNAEGMIGESGVWGKRTSWVALTAVKENERITIVMIDQVKNPYYPAWPHAREYGLFAMNNLGGKTMYKTSESPAIILQPGEKIVFRHMLVISGELTNKQINKLRSRFWYTNK